MARYSTNINGDLEGHFELGNKKMRGKTIQKFLDIHTNMNFDSSLIKYG